jgi:flagellar basal body rod protein FlgF
MAKPKPQEQAQQPSAVQTLLGNQKLVGADVKAWLANGLEELRSVMTPTTTGVQMGNTPGTMLTPTTGEQTADRMGRTMDVPARSMDGFLRHAEQQGKDAYERMGQEQERDHGHGM